MSLFPLLYPLEDAASTYQRIDLAEGRLCQ
jgi:hypothetical protein